MPELGPVDHVTRPPLPWRTEPHITECGKPLDGLDGRLITTAELDRRVNQLGQARAAYTTCMTCWDTACRHRSDRPDPIGVLARELEGLRWASPVEHCRAGTKAWKHAVRRERLVGELEALAALVAAHREEFDGYLADRGEAVSLAEARATRQRRAPRPRMGGAL